MGARRAEVARAIRKRARRAVCGLGGAQPGTAAFQSNLSAKAIVLSPRKREQGSLRDRSGKSSLTQCQIHAAVSPGVPTMLSGVSF